MGISPISALLALVFVSAVCADVYSCAGFVKSSSPLDYAKLSFKVKLLTIEGHLKNEEEVNPSNGYFMIPVYNKGQYTLRVSSPPGYHFEPDTYDIKIDGVNDVCSKNEDIIFDLKGFSIQGVVDGAPAGMTLILTENGKQIDSAVTAEGGKYEMRAPAGKYEVSTAPGASECISRGKTAVEVKNSPVVVTPNLKISGYQLSIVAQTQKKTPFADAVVTLYASSLIDIPNIKCETSEGAVNVPASHRVKCPLGKTNSQGKLSAACIPSGNYHIAVTHEDGFTSIGFEPNPSNTEIAQAAKEVKFLAHSASGRVRVLAKELPVSNVDVFVNGQKAGQTDSQGYLTLEGLRDDSQTTVTAHAPLTHFSSVRVSVDFPRVKIDDVVVQKFEICGKVEKSETGKIETLTITRTDDKRSMDLTPNSDGSFCQPVSPGVFVIEPTDKTSSLTPRHLEVNLLQKPVTDLRFTHFKTNAIVHVSCIGACPTATISLYLPGQTLVRSVKGTDIFTFENIGPGTYSARLDDNGRGCWEQSEMSLVVAQGKTNPTIHFVQNGFAAQIEISHPADIKWVNTDQKQLNGKSTSKGGEIVSLCVPTSGVYEVSLDSCYKFEQQKFTLSVPYDGVSKQKALAARISGIIDLEGDKSATVSMRVKSSAGERDIPVSTADGRFTFEEPIASSGEPLLFVPSSSLRLFEPTSQTIKVSGKCEDEAVTFKSFRGIFLDGSIRPAVEKAKIQAVLKADPSVVIETVSNKAGQFKIGPVRRVEDYEITANLDGYRFIPKTPLGSFESVKLSQLSISIVDELTNEPLDGVLLSLVGGKGAGSDYRSNNVLDASAHKNFVALAPGEYFVRAILQEYKFAPSTTTIQVKEGVHENVVLKGKRVSFSAYGKMREMSGTPVTDMVIEALSDGCDKHQTEGTTGSDGTYRLRGLLPNCKYQVYAKTYVDGTPAPHSFPRQFTVEMTPEDVKSLDFVATKVAKTTDIAVEIGMETLDIQSVRVVITKNNNEHVQTASVVVPQHLHYLVNLPRDGAEYAIRVEPEKPPHAFAAKTVRVAADMAMKVARVPLSSAKRAIDIEISMGSLLALPFFISLALVFFNQNRVVEYLESLIEWAQAFRANRHDNNQRKRR